MMKLKSIVLSAGLLFSVPGLAGAQGTVPDTNSDQRTITDPNKPCNCQDDGSRHHHMHHKDFQAIMAQREQNLLTWVGQYTPEKKAEWTTVLAEKKQLFNQWMSPANAKKREQWKSEKMAKFNALKKQLDEGKITKEEFVKKIHDGKEKGHWKTYHELKLAVEKKDNTQAAALLNQMLVHYKQQNAKMKGLLAK
ncbi:hypothetical protein HPT25_18080 [Bacillus sp. BRMEA1]|uniref:hypothetical protein n=1 Tax=Neobacillus endophyticus TaxID=2738405 RepID=UPI0015644B95|nr:hypothetical protein [Neobacillus endophyticus]NRD79271.1 hypothetical protein [Neobacillus endophyticus]